MRFPGPVFAIILAGMCAFGCKQDAPSGAYGETLDLKIDPASVESGSTANVIADVKEAMMPKPGVKVTFSASGNCGSLSGSSSTTQSGTSIGYAGAGQAIVTYRANSPYSTCSSIITATTKSSATGMVTVTPRALTRTAPDSAVQAGDSPPSVIVIPDVQMPVSNGFQASYSVTANNGQIDKIRIQTSQNATCTTSNGAGPPAGSAQPNPRDTVLVESNTTDYNSDVVTVQSDSLRLGRLIMTVTLKNPGGQPIELKFVDPVTREGALPGPG